MVVFYQDFPMVGTELFDTLSILYFIDFKFELDAALDRAGVHEGK